MLNCKFDSNFNCFRPEVCECGVCDYPSLLSCLKSILYLLTKENERFKSRQMQKHTKASIKWRDKAFYYKKKARALEDKYGGL